MTDADPLWPTPWVRAAMGTALLAVLAEEPLHGYAIAERLAERGLGRPKGGSLYPLLNSLEQQGAIAASWSQGDSGPGRRTYRLTDVGRERLSWERDDWHRLVAALEPSSPAAHSQEDAR